jgi:hypothetical protein
MRSPPPHCGVSEFFWHDSSTYSVLSVNNCLLPRLSWAGSQLRCARSILRKFQERHWHSPTMFEPVAKSCVSEASGGSSGYRLDRFRELCRCRMIQCRGTPSFTTKMLQQLAVSRKFSGGKFRVTLRGYFGSSASQPRSRDRHQSRPICGKAR